MVVVMKSMLLSPNCTTIFTRIANGRMFLIFVEEAQNAVRREPGEVWARVQLVQADMCDFTLDQTFAMATVPFRAFQHVTAVEDEIAALHTIYPHLAWLELSRRADLRS